jgi:hypothetical protein
MPPPRYETPCRPMPKPAKRSPMGLRITSAVAVLGLLGGNALLLGGASQEQGQGRERPTAAPAPTSAPAPTRPKVVAPPVASIMTSEVVPTPTTTEPIPTPPPTTQRPRPRDERFAVVGDRCAAPGALSITARRVPVVCHEGSWHQIRTN